MEPRSTREDARVAEAERFAKEVLPAVSRTFALSIRLLPGALGRAVRTAYLLCRIADTIEDEPRLPASEKAILFDELLRCFDDSAVADSFPHRLGDLQGRPADVRLAMHTDLVFALYRSLTPATQAQLNFVHSAAPTPEGGYLIADEQNNVIRKISPAGIITTVAGTGFS